MEPAGYAGCGTATRDMALTDRLGEIECPTLGMTGTRDTSTPFDPHGAYLAPHIAGAALVALDAAHLAPLERPHELAAALSDFLPLR